MNRILLSIPILALILLGAHELRQGDYGLAASLILFPTLFVTQQSWLRLATIAVLVWGGLEWAQTTVSFISFRQAMGAPWTRLATIMGGVIFFNCLGLWVLLTNTCRSFFSKDSDQATTRAAMFILTVVGLAAARANVSFPILLADRYFMGWGWLEIFLLGFYAQWIGGKMLSPKGHRMNRPRIWGLFSAVFFGQLVLGLIGMERMLMTGTLHLPVPALIVAGPLFRGDGFFMIILFTVTVLLVGPAWCSHLCYIGAWDDAMSRVGQRPAPSKRIRRYSIWGRLGTLILVVVMAVVLRLFGVSGVNAVSLAAVFGAVGLAVMLVISRKAGLMVHCTTYCPMGIVANVLSKVTPWRIRIGDGCTQCGACLTRCRYNALDEESLGRGKPAISCTMCGDCVSACRHSQISYNFPGLDAGKARTLFITLIVSLHAIFLGVARI